MSNKFKSLEIAEIDVSPVSRFSADEAEKYQTRPKFMELQLTPNPIFAAKHFNEVYGQENWLEDCQALNGKFYYKISVRMDNMSPLFSRIGIDSNEEKAFLKAASSLGYGSELLTLPKLTCGTQPSDFNGKYFKKCFHVGEISFIEKDGNITIQHLSIIDQYNRPRIVMEYGKQVKNRQSTANGQQPKANDQRPMANSQLPNTNNQVPTALDALDFGERVIVDAINSCNSFDELKEIYRANGSIDQDDNIYQFFENKYNEFKKGTAEA